MKALSRPVAGRPVGLAPVLALCFPLPAAAQGLDGKIAGADVWLGLAGLGLILAAGAAWRFRRLWRRSEERAQRAAREADAIRRALRDGGAAVWHRDPDGIVVATDRLTALLGLPAAPDTLDAFTRALQPASSERLRSALASGENIAVEIVTLSGHTLAAEGRQRAGSETLVLHDVGPFRAAVGAAEAAQVQAQAEAGRSQSLLDALPVAVWRRDAQGELVWANGAMARQLETTVPAILADRIEFAASFDRGVARALSAKALRSGAMQTQLRSLVVAGERRRFRVVEAPFEGGTLGLALDATDEEALRAELKRHVAGHAEVLQNLATAICVWDAGRQLVLHNRAFARIWGIEDSFLEQGPTYGELLEHLRDQRKLPEQADWAQWKRARMQLFTTVLEPREELMHLPDERTLRVVTTPHPFGGLLMTYEDVTNQFVLERARNTLAAVQRATLDNLYEAVVVFGDDGRLKLYNPAFTRIWRIDAARLEGEPHIDGVAELLRPVLGDGEDWAATRGRLIAPFHARERDSGRIETGAGPVLDYATVPLPDGAMLFTFWDVSDSVSVERVLIERNQALQAADQLKSEFIANVSHELRTPLNTVIGFGEILVNQYFGELNERQREYAEGVLESSHILLHLIDDILDLATIEAGHMALAPKPVDLHATLDGVVRLARHRAREKGLTLDLDCPEDVGSVVADERRLRQVLFNLVSNSIKFTPAGGQILLGARHGTSEVEMWVSDTGIGIPDDERKFAFDRFAKGRAGQRQTGAGLGLALVKSFIELHGGRVELDTPQKGTTVRCFLPAAERQSAADA